MITISIPSLIVIIQVISRQVNFEQSQLEKMDKDDINAEALSLSLADLGKTLNELKGAYEKARSEGYNLEPIKDLLL